MTGAVLETMDQKQLPTLVLLDLAKAFDSSDHEIVLKELRSLGISSDTIELFISYLTDRNWL